MLSYFVITTPGCIQKELLQAFEISNVQFGLLFSVYSLPNIILALLTGVLLDKIGIRRSAVLYTGAIFTGGVLFTYGTHTNSFQVALIGRLIMG
jgi:predicted MFS family arabinose efflux permease